MQRVLLRRLKAIQRVIKFSFFNMETNEYRSKDFTGAIFLIFVGIIFLLNTTNVVSWSIWLYIFKFWPVFLILGGLKLVLGKSLISDIVLSVLSLLIYLTVGIFSYISVTERNLPIGICGNNGCVRYNLDQSVTEKKYTVFKDEYVESVKKKNVNLNIGGAKFDVSDDSLSEYLDIDAHYPRSYKEPTLEEKVVQKDTLNIDFNSATPSSFPIFYKDSTEYNFILGRNDVPTDINLTLGAGYGVVTLDDGVYTKIQLITGAGQLTMRLGGRSIPSDELNIKIGAGENILELPEDVGYVIEYDLGVGAITSSEGDIAIFAADSKVYKSKNYDSSEKKIKIVASVGVGSLVINRY